MELQLTEIKGSVEKSRTRADMNLIKEPIFSDIIRRVSQHAIDRMVDEIARNKKFDVRDDPYACGCYYRRTHGIPCSHECYIYFVTDTPIPLYVVHNFWKKLDIEVELNSKSSDTYCRTDDQLLLDLHKAPPPLRRSVLKGIKDALYPREAAIEEPIPIQPKGRPRKSSYAREPSRWEHVEDFYGIKQAPRRRGAT